MSKLVENTFRDINIAFANELSMICDDLQIDIDDVIKIANMHPRVDILQPGPGVGGHCIPVDPWFIVEACPSKTHIIQKARHVNLLKEKWVVNKITDYLRANSFKSVCFVGVSYKKDVGDFRESPAVRIIEELIKTIELPLTIADPFITRFFQLREYEISFECHLPKNDNCLYVIFQKHTLYQSVINNIYRNSPGSLLNFSS